jgi:ribose-phosphate pyrophosphokinase
VSHALGSSLGKIDLKNFSCGERYVRFGESVRGKDVYLLQTGGPHPNESLIELFLMCQAAKLSFARTVHVVLPHFPYARQDRIANWREPISAKLIAHLLEESGADHIITLNLHSAQIQGFFQVPVDVLDSGQILAEYLQRKKLKDLVIVSPDIGGAKNAKVFADLVGAELAILHKTRPAHHRAEILEVVGDVSGKTCVIYDDMIDTAGTLLAAKQALLKAGAAKDVYAAATHAILSGEAGKRLRQAKFREVIVTDTLPIASKGLPKLTVLSVAPLLAEVIEHVEHGKSVTEIYGKKKH